MTYYLSLGANIGNREQTIRLALQLIEQRAGVILRCSDFYYSKPWGFESQHDFCNLCCAVQTDLLPLKMLAVTQTIERELGRTHKSRNGIYSDRTIDIDLIRAFDDHGAEISSEGSPLLTLPHPLWQQREFVTKPLSQIL